MRPSPCSTAGPFHLRGPRAKYLGSAGKRRQPSPGSDVRRTRDRTLGPGVPGEISREGGKHIMIWGYWKNRKLTDRVLHGGWCVPTPGTWATWDEEGFLFMTDRKADMIISGARTSIPRRWRNVILPASPRSSSAPSYRPQSEKWGEIVAGRRGAQTRADGDGERDHGALQEDPWPDTSARRRWRSGTPFDRPSSARSSRRTSRQSSGKEKSE